MTTLSPGGTVSMSLTDGTDTVTASLTVSSNGSDLGNPGTITLGSQQQQPQAGLSSGGATYDTAENVVPNGVTAGNLTLQIGDTSDSYNQMTVKINDTHMASLFKGATTAGEVDISTASAAGTALSQIKNAINYVSDIRGELGATQNRLEHTINNLSVMQENIQDAESTIRDTDVADEMMKYTKNSILVQSAQAMLAQANQQPQGVLQLLQ
jgi:flagellin